jgi:hypothetical protein
MSCLLVPYKRERREYTSGGFGENLKGRCILMVSYVLEDAPRNTLRSLPKIINGVNCKVPLYQVH